MNLILATDSYKENHWNQYPTDTEVVYSYLESREGAKFDETVFFGLQYILKKYLSKPITRENIEEAAEVCLHHFGRPDLFNRSGWEYILSAHGGRLPLEIRAVAEGTVVPEWNVMMTVQNTDPKCFWLTNFVESLLTHVWYPSTVATLSRHTKKMIASYLSATSDNMQSLPFMLHDFGYRGVSSHESAEIGGAGHLVNFKGTDTLPAIQLLRDYYGAELSEIGYSVPATEHSVMTALGEHGEGEIVDRLLEIYPTGILSVVADSYDIYRFVDHIVGYQFRQRILNRNGVFVVRPDSLTGKHGSPATLVRYILESLWRSFGGSTVSGYRVLNPKVRVLWGDGIDHEGINNILWDAKSNKFAADNLVFGMGGGLLQKVNRDTQRFAFKCSAMKRGGKWVDIQKKPLDSTKVSKPGRLALVVGGRGEMTTLTKQSEFPVPGDLLERVYLDGEITNEDSLLSIRARANHGVTPAAK